MGMCILIVWGLIALASPIHSSCGAAVGLFPMAGGLTERFGLEVTHLPINQVAQNLSSLALNTGWLFPPPQHSEQL